MSDIRFITCHPPASVEGSVRELWLLEDEGRLHTGLPKPYVEVVVNLGGVHWWRNTADGHEHRYDEPWVTPIQQAPRHARSDGARILMGARLEPWAAQALFGPLPLGDGQPPPHLASFIGKSAALGLQRRLRAAPNDAARFDIFGRWLGAQDALRSKAAPLLTCQDARADTLAAAQATTPRTLRRRVAAATGMAPKRWLTLARIDRVLRDPALAEAGEPLAAIAHDHGYADQAHFTREVVRITGTTPGRLRRRPPGSPPHMLPED